MSFLKRRLYHLFCKNITVVQNQVLNEIDREEVRRKDYLILLLNLSMLFDYCCALDLTHTHFQLFAGAGQAAH